MAIMTVDELLRAKANQEVWTVKSQATINEALQLMAEKDIGALMVVDGDSLVGIFSERDYARKVLIKGKCSLETPVNEVMTSEVITVTPAISVEACMELMTNRHIRHLPVIQEGRLVGLVSIGDIVKAIISGQANYISNLVNYITGSEYGTV